jgi:hypothetical protein
METKVASFEKLVSLSTFVKGKCMGASIVILGYEFPCLIPWKLRFLHSKISLTFNLC